MAVRNVLGYATAFKRFSRDPRIETFFCSRNLSIARVDRKEIKKAITTCDSWRVAKQQECKTGKNQLRKSIRKIAEEIDGHQINGHNFATLSPDTSSRRFLNYANFFKLFVESNCQNSSCDHVSIPPATSSIDSTIPCQIKLKDASSFATTIVRAVYSSLFVVVVVWRCFGSRRCSPSFSIAKQTEKNLQRFLPKKREIFIRKKAIKFIGKQKQSSIRHRIDRT